MNRRAFLGSSAGAAAFAATPAATRLPIRKAVEFSMLPASASVADRFRIAREAGFEEVECGTTPDPSMAEELLAGSKTSGLRIHSVMNMAHWNYPLSSPDPDVVAKSIAGMETSLRNAKLWGADTVLLVPAVVKADVSYSYAWTRSQTEIRKLIKLAAELKVVIGIEEVWNHFLLSPLEFAKYVDEFNSPWVKAYFDVGNIVLFSYPQDWIRILGPRIVKLHFKDFRFRPVKGTGKIEAEFVNLQEGDIDWKQIHAALKEIGYKGTATVELHGGDADYLKDVSRRVEAILSGV
jgi:L-ribulose-5-phosphate 3-epimerase